MCYEHLTYIMFVNSTTLLCIYTFWCSRLTPHILYVFANATYYDSTCFLGFSPFLFTGSLIEGRQCIYSTRLVKNMFDVCHYLMTLQYIERTYVCSYHCEALATWKSPIPFALVFLVDFSCHTHRFFLFINIGMWYVIIIESDE